MFFMKRFLATISLVVVVALVYNATLTRLAYGEDAVTPTSSQAFSAESFILPGGIVEQSSPVLADLNEDGKLDIIVGTTAENGAANNARNRPIVLVAMEGNGHILWSKTLDAPMNSSPAVADINHDGHLEVVVSTGGDSGDIRHNGSVIAFDRNGNQLWRFNLVDNSPNGALAAAFSSPTLCDLNGDGMMEVVVGAWNQRIYVIDHNGKPIWFNLNRPGGFPADAGYFTADTIWSTAACADLNGDGQQEIIIGADSTGGGTLPDGTRTQDGGFLYVFDKNGNVLARRSFPEVIWSSPVVGDLNHDGRLEIVVGTGWYWWNQHGRKSPSYVYALDTAKVFSDLNYGDPAKLPDLPGWPQQTTYPGFSSPALADLTGDGKLEVIIGTGDPFVQNDNIPGAGQVYAWHANGQLVSGWPVSPKNSQGNDAYISSSPTVADIDGDGKPEVLFSMVWDVNIYSANGAFKGWLNTGWTTVGSPAIGDTNGDGKVDVWIGSGNALGDRSSGYLWHFKNSAANIGALPWPMFHQNARHTGLYPAAPKPLLPMTQLLVLRDTNNSNAPLQLNSSFALGNTGGVGYGWQVINKPGQVTVQPAQGVVDPRGRQVIQTMIDTNGLGNGIHTLGNIQIEATSNGVPIAESPFTMAVTAYVGNVYYSYLPIVH